MKMKCPKCNSDLRKVNVKVQGADNRAISYQCPKCDYFEFEPLSSKKVIEELRETPLKIKQKIIKLLIDKKPIWYLLYAVKEQTMILVLN